MESSVYLIWATVLCFFVAFCKWATLYNDYFKKMGIQYMKPYFLIGNSENLLTKKLPMNEMFENFYQKFPNEKIMGIFQFRRPLFILRDPDLIKQVGIKDFDSYIDHQSFMGKPVNDLFGNSLFALTGDKWRDMRATLSPVFTGSKMRNMFGLISKCSENMVSTFNLDTKTKGPQVHEMKNLFTRFTTDVVATSAFGIEVNSFKDRDNLVYRLATTIADFNSPTVGLKVLGFFMAPWLMNLLNISFLDGKASKYFTEVIRKNFETREKDKIVRNDVIQLLMQIKKGQLNHQQHDEKSQDAGFATVEESELGKKIVKREWTEIELIAQCFIFFLAGFDTSSTILSFVAYELALNPDVQQRLYEEVADINRQLNGGSLTYESLQKMSYMDMVISEGLRKWPPVMVTDRAATRKTTLQVDDKTIEVEKGVNFWIPIYALHHDTKYYPNPNKFDPERFSEENKHNIQQYTYLPFGIGPRNCIGSRFALMTLKSAFYNILLNFSLEVTAKTQIPLKIAKTAASFYTENGIHLELRPRIENK